MLNIHVQYRYRYRYWQNLSYKYRVSEVSAKTGIGTPLVEIEAHLNYQPLTYISSDLNEPEPVTPSHLLYGRVIDTLPFTEDEILDEGKGPSHDHTALLK